MNASDAVPVFGTFFLLLALTLSILVRSATAAFSPRVRRSIVRHPAIHLAWAFGSLLSATVLVIWLYPHLANRS
jgi:hypothetical protein